MPIVCEPPVLRQPFLVRPPAELRRLQALRQKAVDRPGIDEDVHRLRVLRALRVALRDVDSLHAEIAHQLRPALAVVEARLVELVLELSGEIDQRLLDEPRDHAGIGAAAGDGGRAARILRLLLANRVAERVVGAGFGIGRAVVVESRPRLDDGVDVERADLAAEAHDVERRRVDREIDAEAAPAAFGQKRLQQLAIIVARHRLLHEADALLLAKRAVGVIRIDDDDALAVEFEMAQDERQRSAADRAEADHHDRTVDRRMDGPVAHDACPLRERGRRREQPNAASRRNKRRDRLSTGAPPIPQFHEHSAALLTQGSGCSEYRARI